MLKNDAGFRMGIQLRKYPLLYDTLINKIKAPVGVGIEFVIPKGRYTSPLSIALRNLIRQQIEVIPDEAFTSIKKSTLSYAASHFIEGAKHVDNYIENVSIHFVNEVAKRIVLPLLSLLEDSFKNGAYSAVESVYDIESDLTDAITIPSLEQFTTPLNTLITTGDKGALIAVMEEFTPTETRQRLQSFFDDFSTSDVFLELRDLENTLNTTENQALYLYLGDVRFGTATFPMFYIPLEVEFNAGIASFILKAEPHLYVNKRALDWVAQEISAQSGRTFISPTQDRILYLDEKDSFLEVAKKQTQFMVKALDLAAEIDFSNTSMQRVDNAIMQMSTSLYLAVFDRSDESILSDYEALLTAVEQDNQLAQEMFTNIVRGMILDEPISANSAIETAWDVISAPDRLLTVSPLPVNEEQRKIQLALQAPGCHYIIVQGPPGTGKSHSISAIAFDAILNGQSILILSDKNEALDVVEDKLAKTLEKVRPSGAGMPNPILRLGKTNSYPKLISTATLERIKEQDRAQRVNADHLEVETKETQEDISKKIQLTIDAFTTVTLNDIKEMQHLEDEIESSSVGWAKQIRRHISGVQHFKAVVSNFGNLPGGMLDESLNYLGEDWRSAENLLEEINIADVTHQLIEQGTFHPSMSMFPSIGTSCIPVLAGFIAEYEQAKWPIFGYFFVKGKVAAITNRLCQTLECTNPMDLHLKTKELRGLVGVLENLKISVLKNAIDAKHETKIYRRLMEKSKVPAGLGAMADIVVSFNKAIPNGWPDQNLSGNLKGVFDFVSNTAKYAVQWERISTALNSAPSFNFINEKTQLEKLHASRMSSAIDHKFVSFVDNNKALARSLGAVIKSKKQFPLEEFDRFSQAFPCIIAGIREYAQYIPLKHQSFDVVVIDEASQVSIAQAFPALIRAKRVVVFGDEKQFSNVKSQQASKERNATYTTSLEAHFRKKVSDSADRIQRLKQFDVKKSVLDFFKLIANAEIMLKKHFRGYQELISFSSVNFYDSQLQAIKVRSKPLVDVLRFEVLVHDKREEKKRNSNSMEVEFILAELKRILQSGAFKTVGVITPFKEQQELLSRILLNDIDADRFIRELRLKIMTFDTCQGEERGLIIYSMVATQEHDALNYVFPISLEECKDRIEDALKVQRLNVGFSRAEEGMLFVLSKPVDSYRGSIGQAIRHYQAALTRKNDFADAVVESPMEAKVLDWLQKTAFYQSNFEQLDLIPQFPVGDYLKQLDANYCHPAYRADFLLTYSGQNKQVRIIIEYDGFSEHFKDREKVTSSNYGQFYKASDIERQYIIESYGYCFLRINRFNLGEDPIATLSDRLYQLVEEASKVKPLKSVDQILAHTEALSSGNSKVCTKCSNIRPLKEFFDQSLSKGRGGHGRICMSCKLAGTSGVLSKADQIAILSA